MTFLGLMFLLYAFAHSSDDRDLHVPIAVAMEIRMQLQQILRREHVSDHEP